MMRLELSGAEEKVLADALDSSLSRLSDEISHTDAYDCRNDHGQPGGLRGC